MFGIIAITFVLPCELIFKYLMKHCQEETLKESIRIPQVSRDTQDIYNIKMDLKLFVQHCTYIDVYEFVH